VRERLGSIPPDIWQRLFPFQREGVRRGLAHCGRCLLGDDMGLGKTVQARSLRFSASLDMPAGCLLRRAAQIVVARCSCCPTAHVNPPFGSRCCSRKYYPCCRRCRATCMAACCPRGPVSAHHLALGANYCNYDNVTNVGAPRRRSASLRATQRTGRCSSSARQRCGCSGWTRWPPGRPPRCCRRCSTSLWSPPPR
jgi:hypothetical protein